MSEMHTLAEPGDDLLLADEPEPAGPGLLARTGAELFGTFVVVFAGAGVMLYQRLSDIGGTLTVALTFGIAWLVAAAAVGRVSGGHFNPAISLGSAIAGRLSWADLLPYWLAQLVGGALGTAVLFLTVPTGLGALLGGSEDRRELITVTANGFDEHSPLARLIAQQGIDSEVAFSMTAALLVEALATAILVGVFLAVSRRGRPQVVVPFVGGLALALLVLVATPVTNASLNPARSTASAILSESWALQQLWLFWVAPLLGAAIAALLYRAFSSPDEDDEVDEYDEYDEYEQEPAADEPGAPVATDEDGEPAGPTGVA